MLTIPTPDMAQYLANAERWGWRTRGLDFGLFLRITHSVRGLKADPAEIAEFDDHRSTILSPEPVRPIDLAYAVESLRALDRELSGGHGAIRALLRRGEARLKEVA